MSQAPTRGFPVSEFEARLAKAQRMMADADLAALLVLTEPEVRYFSGFLSQFWQSPTRPWFLVVPASGKPVAVIPAIGGETMGRTWIDDIRTWPSPTPKDEGVSMLADAIREVVGDGRIGLPMGPETSLRMAQNDFLALKADLPGNDFVDCTDIVRGLRMVKSDAEIEKIAYVCGTVSGVFERLPEFVSTGMADIDIFRAFKIECLKAGVDDVSYLVGAAGPGGYGDIISPPSNRATQEGDVLILDTGCVFDGYFCDFDRNYAFGQVSNEVANAHAVVYEATNAGFEAARIGNTTSDVFRAMQGVMVKGGALGNDVGRLGHGLGMQLTEWPSNTEDDETEIVENMVLTLEPGMTFAPGKVMVHEENLVVRKDGAEYLSRRAPATMPVIG